MKGFLKTKLALATAATMLSGGAIALDASFPAAEPDYALNLLGVSTAEVSNTQVFNINTVITDLVIGRTTGFGIRMTLTGADFAAGATSTIGSDIVGAVDPDEDWLVSAETIAGNTATITVSPGIVPAGLPVGSILEFGVNDLDVTAVDGSLGAGTDVTALIEFFDPVTAAVLLTTTSVIYSSREATLVTIAGGDTVSRVDVGGQNSPSKTNHSLDGTINAAGVNATNRFYAGIVTAGLSAATSAAGTLALDYNDGGDNFGYDSANSGDDTLSIVLSGTDFSSFSSVWLEETAGLAANLACTAGNGATVPDSNVAGVGTPLLASGETLNADIDLADSGESFYVCIATDGVTIIDDQDLDVSATIALDTTPDYTTTLVSPATTTGSITPLVYNGDVIEVHFFNDNGNVGQESRLRISNKGNTAGLVRIVGIDDAGVSSAEATLTLGPRQSLQVRNGDLVNGTGSVTGAMGLPTQGKWRLTVTAEYDGLEVTNFVRNIDSGILTNFTPSKTAQP